MKTFVKFYVDELFKASNENDDFGEIYLVLPNKLFFTLEEISLQEAFLNTLNHNAIFVFSANDISINNDKEANDFVEQIKTIINQSTKNDRYMIWVSKKISYETSSMLGINSNTTKVTASLSVYLAKELEFIIANGTSISIDYQTSELVLEKKDGPCIQFQGSKAFKYIEINKAVIAFSAKNQGCINFYAYIYTSSLVNKLAPGFSMFYHKDKLYHYFFNFIDANQPKESEYIRYFISIDPSDIYNQTIFKKEEILNLNRRTHFTFANNQSNILYSYFKTIYNDKIQLIPTNQSNVNFNMISSRFVLTGYNDGINLLAPEGDFLLVNQNSHENNLLCGIEGSEYIRFNNKDYFRFLFNFPGYSPLFPLPVASTLAKPIPLNEKLMTNDYITSWATIISQEELRYINQPKGLAYYGDNDQDFLVNDTTGMIIKTDSENFFPLMPYAGYLDKQNNYEALLDFERLIIFQERKKRLMNKLMFSNKNNEVAKTIITPMGVLAQITNEGLFENIFLANNEFRGKKYSLYFEKPSVNLSLAFQTNQLFLVVNNVEELGKMMDYYQKNNSSSFHNTLNVEDWIFHFNIGEKNQYNDYKSVMIIKGCQGKIYDIEDKDLLNNEFKSLVGNPNKWTQKEVFASPAIETGEKDDRQLVNLSTWLMQYCEKNINETNNEYFTKFNQIIQDPDWQGILFLNVILNDEDIPQSLKGITCGLKEGEKLNAHHIGINITQIKQSNNDIKQDENSSIFGLIYYEDREFKQTKSYLIPSSEEYDFQLLTLKVLFNNSSVNQFESKVQLTLNTLFSFNPEKNDSYNSIMLMGSYQDNNGNPIYNLQSNEDSLFYFNNNILNKIEITNVQMMTIDTIKNIYRFGIDGFIDFKLLEKIDPERSYNYDLFSYGSMNNDTTLKKGLSFLNLGLIMTKTTINNDFVFNIEQIRFNLDKSTLRQNSLTESLVLQLEKMIYGNENKKPEDFGYLEIVSDIKKATLTSDWYGLVYRLQMGTLGEMAEKINLTSYLLIAFNQESSSNNTVYIGIKLPGNGGKVDFISIQNILKLSINQIWLMYNNEQKVFMLLFSDIAIKIFGLLKIPPSGSTMFYLFGNPNSKESKELGWYAMYAKNNNRKEK